MAPELASTAAPIRPPKITLPAIPADPAPACLGTILVLRLLYPSKVNVTVKPCFRGNSSVQGVTQVRPLDIDAVAPGGSVWMENTSFVPRVMLAHPVVSNVPKQMTAHIKFRLFISFSSAFKGTKLIVSPCGTMCGRSQLGSRMWSINQNCDAIQSGRAAFISSLAWFRMCLVGIALRLCRCEPGRLQVRFAPRKETHWRHVAEHELDFGQAHERTRVLGHPLVELVGDEAPAGREHGMDLGGDARRERFRQGGKGNPRDHGVRRLVSAPADLGADAARAAVHHLEPRIVDGGERRDERRRALDDDELRRRGQRFEQRP